MELGINKISTYNDIFYYNNKIIKLIINKKFIYINILFLIKK